MQIQIFKFQSLNEIYQRIALKSKKKKKKKRGICVIILFTHCVMVIKLSKTANFLYSVNGSKKLVTV